MRKYLLQHIGTICYKMIIPHVKNLSLLTAISISLMSCSTVSSRMNHANALIPKENFTSNITLDDFVPIHYKSIRLPNHAAATAAIYIEGDGFAYISKSRPSKNPTPKTPVGLLLSLQDHKSKAIYYIGRPCQYIEENLFNEKCREKHWTTHRYAPEIIDSFHYVLDHIKSETNITQFDLIGFSGGANIAGLLATTRKDVKSIRTVAGNVDNIFFTRYHNVSAMPYSLIVHESLADELTEKLVKFTKSKVVGDPQNEETELGPLIAERQVVKLEGQLEDAVNKGANILCGGKRPEDVKGAYFELTLLNNIKPEMEVWHDEVFGPILPIITFKTYDEAIRMANDNIYGLSAYIYTKDKELANKAIDDLEAGTITVHGANPYGPYSPFGGYKRSGLGRTGGIRGFRDVAQLKTVARVK
jgi:hypothetical protein